MVVENSGGAGGNIAAAAVAKAEPDGYTILVTTSAFAVNQTLSKNPGYAADDFRAAAVVATTPNLIIGAPTLKANNLKEAVELAKTEKMSYGTAGVGTTPHLSAERIFKLEAKVDIPHAPFTGAGPATQAVIGSHIPLASVAMSAAVANVKAGQVKGLAVTSKERVASLPECADRARARTGRGRRHHLGGVLRAGENARRGDRQDQCRRQCDPERQGHPGPARQDRLHGGRRIGRRTPKAYVQSETRRWGDIIKKIGLEAQ